MLILVKHKINNEYYTIYKKDKDKFLRLRHFFKTDTGEEMPFNFELIEDRNVIKKILEENFSSKGRGQEYDENIPSVTKIAYNLFPFDIDKDKFLIRYLNNKVISETDKKETDLTLSKGTFIHKILELWIIDKKNRDFDKPYINSIKILKQRKKPSKKLDKVILEYISSYIRKYIDIAFKDSEIKMKISNLDEIKDCLSKLALDALPKFIYSEIINTDLVYSEIFLTIPNYIQGSIDLVGYKENKFTIIDFKTTSSLDKKTGKPKFKNNSQLEPYSRQLAIYNELLKRSNMSHLSNDTLPEFYIYQIHLINNTYKKLEIPKYLIKYSTKEVEKVLNWYWAIRNDQEFDYAEEDNNEDLYMLTL